MTHPASCFGHCLGACWRSHNAFRERLRRFWRRLRAFLNPKYKEGYHYESLRNAREDTRIVTILPGTFNDPIKCKLETVRLEEQPGTSSIEEALSYVCGDPKSLSPITLDGRSISITTNLESALRYLRYKDQPRKMWIDALSINQADNNEKSNQIALMRQIFRGAKVVIVWLGTSESGELAFEMFRELVADPDQHLDLAITPHLNARLMDRSHVEALLQIGDNELWRRLWIVQECVMAQKLEFICSSNSIDGTTLLEALGHITRHGRSCCSNLIHAKDDHPLRPFFTSDGNVKGRDVKNYRELFSTSDIELLDAMGTYRLQKTYDDRDKIYGLLGLATGLYKDFIEADYSLTVEQVYEEAAIRFIRRTATFDLLSHIVNSTDESLPSWIVDWRTPWAAIASIRIGLACKTSTCIMRVEALWPTSGTPAQVSSWLRVL